MADLARSCAELRARLVEAKGARNRALADNAHADDEGRDRPYSDDDLAQLRIAVDAAALAARRAGCDVSDLVGGLVGNPERDRPR